MLFAPQKLGFQLSKCSLSKTESIRGLEFGEHGNPAVNSGTSQKKSYDLQMILLINKDSVCFSKDVKV